MSKEILTKEEQEAREAIAERLRDKNKPWDDFRWLDFEGGAKEMFNLLWPMVKEAVNHGKYLVHQNNNRYNNGKTDAENESEYLTSLFNKLK